jgi:hypothetical protein
MRRRGYSLAEIMVSCFVLTILILGTLNIFLPCMQAFQVTDADYDAQRNVINAEEKMANDMVEAEQEWIYATPTMVAIPTARAQLGLWKNQFQQTPLGPTWQGWIIYWTAPDPNLAGAMLLNRGPVAQPLFQPTAPPPAPAVGEQLAAGVTSLNLNMVATSVANSLGPVSVSALAAGKPADALLIEVRTQRVPRGLSVTYGGNKAVATF